MPDQLKCPKCDKGVMRLPLAQEPPQSKLGSVFTCNKCGYQTTSLKELLRPPPPKSEK
jgi:hypothetical protein